MKTKFNSIIHHSFGGVILAGAFLLISSTAQAQNLFVSTGTNIIEITPGGGQSTFATGLIQGGGVAINSAGDVFVADNHTPNVFEYTTNGTQSTFASGLPSPSGLAFDHAGNLFVGSASSGNIYEITTNGTQSAFASVSGLPEYLAFAPNSF